MVGSVADYWIRKRGRLLTSGERLERKRQWQRAYRERTKERSRELGRIHAALYRERHQSELQTRKRSEYIQHADKYKERTRLWRINNPTKVAQYNQSNKENQKRLYHTPRCIGCECILKHPNTKVCDWCLCTYPHKYATI